MTSSGSNDDDSGYTLLDVAEMMVIADAQLQRRRSMTDERDMQLLTQAEHLRGYRQELEDTLYLLKERTAEITRLQSALAQPQRKQTDE